MEKILSKSANPDSMWATANKKNNKNMQSSQWITENFKSLVISKSQPPRYESNWASIKALMEIKEIYAKKVLLGAITFICLIGFSACKDEVVPPEPKIEHPIIGKKWELIAQAGKIHSSLNPVPDTVWENAQAKDYFELLPDSSFKRSITYVAKYLGEPDPAPDVIYSGVTSNGNYYYYLTDSMVYADPQVYGQFIVYRICGTVLDEYPSLDDYICWEFQEWQLSDDGKELILYLIKTHPIPGTTQILYRNFKYRRAN